MKDNAYETAELIRNFEKQLSPLFDKAVEARDAAQEVVSAINQMKQDLTKQALDILNGAQK